MKFAIWCVEQCWTDIEEIKEYTKIIKRFYAGQAIRKELCRADWPDDWKDDGEAYGVAYWTADWADDSAAERNKQIKKLLTMI